MESVKNQTVKITIEPMNLWIWKSFENLEGIICGACSQYKEPEPQQQQYLQQLTIIYSTLILSTSTLFITTFYTSMKCSLVWNDSSLNAFTLRIIWIWASSSSNVWWFFSSSFQTIIVII
ncbi:unnamed protein product [Paramecium sonneborni]|uniref:Transmembrane protein n=1 Tax=Paramecium sonneborni TaxID=65129 RepID=A0A8S1M1I5_9CILI|nr:unnamed protein product [Paramecium sonneborni]